MLLRSPRLLVPFFFFVVLFSSKRDKTCNDLDPAAVECYCSSFHRKNLVKDREKATQTIASYILGTEGGNVGELLRDIFNLLLLLLLCTLPLTSSLLGLTKLSFLLLEDIDIDSKVEWNRVVVLSSMQGCTLWCSNPCWNYRLRAE